MTDLLIIFCAKYLIYVMALLFAVFLVWRFSLRKLSFAAVTFVLAYGFREIAGHLYSHIQPFAAQGFTPLIAHAVDNSFPSDHMLLASAMASVVFVYNRTLGVLLWICALAIGIARVAAGLHYPVDIATSVLIAIAATALSYFVISCFFQRGE